MMGLGSTLRAYPTLLRIGVAQMLAYRAEFLIWILTTNMPLVMMGLWTGVAADGVVGRFDQRDFVAYYLAVLAIRILTNNWLVWELTMEIRQGTLAARLLRPIHPLVSYSAVHVSALPIRAVVITPILGVLLWTSGDLLTIRDPAMLAVFLSSVVGAWLILFLTMLIIGTLALYVDSAMSVFDLWLAIHFVLSGYLVPLELLPSWVEPIAMALPFRYTLAFPVELLIGKMSLDVGLSHLGVQWMFVVALGISAALFWRAGMRRFVAFGG
ncbi:MAG: ABC-2 family transporter protein [Deltaproteobacteria bacterium]|nr:ABC-2 family transporter protein [Deltaproteobacteria bacterium]